MTDPIRENEYDYARLMHRDGMTQPIILEKIRVGAAGRYMMSLIQSWGLAVIMAEGMHAAHHGDQPHENPTDLSEAERNRRITALVTLAAEVTQKTYDEIRYRQWLIDLPPLPDEPCD